MEHKKEPREREILFYCWEGVRNGASFHWQLEKMSAGCECFNGIATSVEVAQELKKPKPITKSHRLVQM